MPVHVTLTISCPENNSPLPSGHTVRLHLSTSLAVKLEPSLQLVVQSLSPVRLFVTPWTATGQASLSFTISWSLLKLMCTELTMSSNHLILLPPSPPVLNLSQHQGLFKCQFFASGSQSIRASASASVLPMNIQGWFPLGLIGLISLLSKGISRVFSSTTVQKHYN